MTRAPARAAASPVPSDEPSSTTRTSCHGAAARSAVTTAPMPSPSLNAGTTIDTDSGDAILGGVTEIDDVAVFDDVFLAFEAQLAAVAARRHRPARHEGVVGDDLGADEPSRDIAVDFPRRIEGARAAPNRPGAAFVLADGEERHVAEQVVTRLNHAIESRFAEAHVGEERLRIRGLQRCDLELDLGAQRDGARTFARKERRHAGALGGLLD